MPDNALVILKSQIVLLRKMDYLRHDIFLNIDSNIENGVRLRSCKREPETVEWIETCFGAGEVFYDIGANVGAYSLVASKFLEGKARVYAFEPSFINYPQLCRNVISNSCQESVFPMQIALSDVTGLDTFNYYNLEPGGAIHTLGEPIDYKGDIFEPVVKQQVVSYRMDDLVENFCMPIPNHIKIDVDGIELKVLQGAERVLSDPQVLSVILEIQEGDAEADEIVAFLRSRGLVYHSKHRYLYGDEAEAINKMYNYIFKRAQCENK